MEGPSTLSAEDAYFYETSLHQLIKDGRIGVNQGAEMVSALRNELSSSRGDTEFPEYAAMVGELFKVVTDSLASAVYRSYPHELINRSMGEFHVATDEEEYQFHQGEDFFDYDEEYETESDSASESDGIAKDNDPKQRKREEMKKKRMDEEELLLKKKQVRDEKGKMYHTVGPHPAPKLTVRSESTTFLSRKSLGQKTVVQSLSQSCSSLDEEEINDLVQRSSSDPASNAVAHLTEFLQPLSLDSLKKLSESAKTKQRQSSPQEEFVSQIVKTAVRLGCEKALSLMDRHKMLDESVPSPSGSAPPPMTIDSLNTLPDNTKRVLGLVLGLPEEEPPVEDMRERMVAMGFLSVLSNLRLKPLKKMATELNIALPDSNSTEKYCEYIVYGAFPRERIREKCSRAKQKKVKFTVFPSGMYTKGDMGFISFEISNISMLTKESERHYSPEFNYAQLKWSLLCMTNKESLALYLCQTGSVHCKFLITVVNHANPDDSICNEGTQSFTAMSAENDWGFNNVIALSDLLNPAQGFINEQADSILIEIGIVLVEPIKPAPAVREKRAQQPTKEKKNTPQVEAAARQLLADEKAEALRKKIKQDMSKALKDEEKTRKDIVQKATKAYHDLAERLRRDTVRATKDENEREKREEQDRQREMDKVREAEKRCQALRDKLEELRRENADLIQERQSLVSSYKDKKKSNEKLSGELKAVTDKLQAEQQRTKNAKKNAEASNRRLEALRRDTPVSPSPSSEDLQP